MARLELVFVFALLFEVCNSIEVLNRFSRPDEDVSLPCGTQSRPELCSRIAWLFLTVSSPTVSEAKSGKIQETSPRAARLSLDSDCSLSIRRITAKDAGRYTCRMDNTDRFDVIVYLSVLTVSQLPAESDQTRNSEVTRTCSLLRYNDGRPCRSNGLRWVDETGTEVTEGVLKSSRSTDCVAHLKRQSGDNRKFTCQFVQKDEVEIQADYTPVGPRRINPDLGSPPDPGSTPDRGSSWSSLSYVMTALRFASLVFMIVCTVLVFSLRGYIKALHKGNKVDEAENEDVIELTYENVGARHPAAEVH